jgi:DNA-binding MarR family transcriptional regulator
MDRQSRLRSVAQRARHGGSVSSTSEDHVTRRAHLDLLEFLPYLLNRVGVALVTRFSDTALAGTQLNIATWRVLAALSNSGPLRQIDIAEITSMDVSTMSRVITRLVQLGLVSRTRSKTSNREVVVELTPKATTLVARLIPIAEALQETATRGLSKQDLAMVKRALRYMHANLVRESAAGLSPHRRAG